MKKDRPMNRLIQGDVGSGKTVVAATAIFMCVMSGFQAVLMAPTSVLANQHFHTITKFFEKFDIKIALLTSGISLKKKNEIIDGVKTGEIDLLIGTHAVLEENVQFMKLGLAVTDEQHRFGVKQRISLSSKNDIFSHVLVMSATPIPRTLGFVLYGDMDISIIKGLPKGRVPIETYTSKTADNQKIYHFFDKQIKLGHQIYVVCPVIESTLESDLNSAIELYHELKDQIFPEHNVGLLHGSMKPREKDETMNLFLNKKIDILVSTTVIEVGVDNPNATVMFIKNAERFGLAQLHQLRGRIGRGEFRSVCILQSDSNQDLAKKRLKTI